MIQVRAQAWGINKGSQYRRSDSVQDPFEMTKGKHWDESLLLIPQSVVIMHMVILTSPFGVQENRALEEPPMAWQTPMPMACDALDVPQEESEKPSILSSS